MRQLGRLLRATICFLFALVLVLPISGVAAAPNIVAAKGTPKHAMVLFIDGGHPELYTPDVMPNFAALSRLGTTYTNARVTFPTDSVPGILGVFAGAPPSVTGIPYDLYYDRKAGKTIEMSETISVPAGQMPHDQVRVPTLFEAAKAKGLRTAFISKHEGYELLQGPSGKGVDLLQLPEVARFNGTQREYDTMTFEMLRGQIYSQTPPDLYGLYVLAPSGAQKSKGVASKETLDELRVVDEQIGRTVQALIDTKQYDDTVIVITADHGNTDTPVIVPQSGNGSIVDFLKQSGIETVHSTPDDLLMVYLRDTNQRQAAIDLLNQPANKERFGIRTIFTQRDLEALGAAPADRTPDFVVIPTDGTNGTRGVIYAKPDATKIAEHGGASEADYRVPLLLVGPGVPAGVVVDDPLQTLLVAPTLANILGLSLPTATVPALPMPRPSVVAPPDAAVLPQD